ncbi:MAG: hypothetical protein EBS18_00605 [Actinobacteria bacterium]|nr:hypothetical protein [Actinomycetota bacterium]
MTKPVTIPNTFATATNAIPLSQLDGDFTAVANAINDANTYSNYAADTGSANAYVVTFTGVSTTYSAGLRIQFKVRFDGTTGKLVQNSAVTVADTTGDITGGKYNGLTVTASTGTLTIANSSSLVTSGANSITLTSTGATNVTLPTSGTLAVIGTAQTFTAAQTFRASNAIRSEAASTQDAIVVAGRAGGTSSYAVTFTPTTLTANRTATFPDESFTVGFRNVPAVGTKTSSYQLAVGDVGKYVQIGSGGSITIPTSTFAEGDIISLFNNTSGSITITCSAPTAYIAGTDTIKTSMTLATRGVATVLFYSATACVVSGNVS